MASPIPVQNIYYLLCYAWNSLEEGDVTDVSGMESTELEDLFARVLISGTNHLLRRGLTREYETQEDEMAAIRGRIDVANSARRMLLQHGRAICRFDELSVNTLPNQIIKTTIRGLAGAEGLNKSLRHQLLLVHRELDGIDDIQLNRMAFRRVQLRRNARFYRFMINVCEVVANSWLVGELPGELRFRDFLRDEKAMARLYENFILNFYRIERPDLEVRKEKIRWTATSSDDSALAYLPTMETDISVRSDLHTLIIDAKYYQSTLSSYYDSEAIHSHNLYQLFAYLKNLEIRGGNDGVASGMLLYPVVNKHLRLQYEIQGHSVHVCTIDLAQDWKGLRDELMELVSDLIGPAVA